MRYRSDLRVPKKKPRTGQLSDEQKCANRVLAKERIVAEHGIGKIKRKWLPLQMNGLQIAMMTAVKRALDPLGILAPGNIL